MFMTQFSLDMSKSKTKMGKEWILNPQEDLNSEEMKKVLKEMLSFENFVNLNVQIIQ
jgi:hypothetical protein